MSDIPDFSIDRDRQQLYIVKYLIYGGTIMGKRVAAILFIFFCTTAAWGILGATVFARTYAADESLRGRVHSTWGAPQVQRPPVACWTEQSVKRTDMVEDGKKVTRTVNEQITRALPTLASDIQVRLQLEYRKKGLLWYSTYKVQFSGDYTYRNDTATEQNVRFSLELPAANAIYDDMAFELDGRPLPLRITDSKATGSAPLSTGQTAVLRVRYRSQGVDSWRYSFGSNVVQVQEFSLHVITDFERIDFPDNTLSPTAKQRTGNGWDLTWSYRSLLSGLQIGITMPEKLQPGPLTARISFFAPVSLFFFFFLMFIITTMRNIDLHPMNYFFLAAAFFAFHLLMAYLVDHIAIHAAFLIAAGTSIFLVISYLRLVIGMRFAAAEAGLTQFCFLVLFSYAFFFEGYTGLSITVGVIVTLFVVMQMTGRIRWTEKFAAARPQDR
jgi:inner membrane protein involved in colicin E2 resistance